MSLEVPATSQEYPWFPLQPVCVRPESISLVRNNSFLLQVTEGMDVVHRIEDQKTYTDDRPIANVMITASGLLPLKKPFYVEDDANE